MQNTLKISEIFDSVQGEGCYTGVPMTFIRLAGCSMHCDFCDTKYTWRKADGKTMTIDQIMQQVSSLHLHHVCITGGEPLEQNILKLVQALVKTHHFVHLETNAANEISIELRKWIDWITISPKKDYMSNDLTYDNALLADEVKFVISNKLDLTHAHNLLDLVEDQNTSLVSRAFFVAVSNNKQLIPMIVESIKTKGGRLGWQLQKTINIK